MWDRSHSFVPRCYQEAFFRYRFDTGNVGEMLWQESYGRSDGIYGERKAYSDKKRGC